MDPDSSPTPVNISHDLYSILGCTPHANKSQLKQKYKELSLRLHPDKSSSRDAYGAPEGKLDVPINFSQVSTAYHTLINDDQRIKHEATTSYQDLLNQQLTCHHSSIHDDQIPISSFKFSSDLNSYTFDCRCGSIFTLDIDDYRLISSSSRLNLNPDPATDQHHSTQFPSPHIHPPHITSLSCPSCSLSILIIPS